MLYPSVIKENVKSTMFRTVDCPVEFVYIHSKDSKDHKSWIGGIVRCLKSPAENFHNHKIK